MSDDLFVPTVGAPPAATGSKPWRQSSLAFPAFFGGPIAITILGVVNARRLGARSAVPLIVVAGVVAFGALLAFYAIPSEPPSSVRPAVIASGLAMYGAQYVLVRTADRVHQLRSGDYASLWGPGFAALAASAVLTVGVLLPITAMS